VRAVLRRPLMKISQTSNRALLNALGALEAIKRLIVILTFCLICETMIISLQYSYRSLLAMSVTRSIIRRT